MFQQASQFLMRLYGHTAEMLPGGAMMEGDGVNPPSMVNRGSILDANSMETHPPWNLWTSCRPHSASGRSLESARDLRFALYCALEG